MHRDFLKRFLIVLKIYALFYQTAHCVMPNETSYLKDRVSGGAFEVTYDRNFLEDEEPAFEIDGGFSVGSGITRSEWEDVITGQNGVSVASAGAMMVYVMTTYVEVVGRALCYGQSFLENIISYGKSRIRGIARAWGFSPRMAATMAEALEWAFLPGNCVLREALKSLCG